MRWFLGLTLVLVAIGCSKVREAVSEATTRSVKAEVQGTGEAVTKAFEISKFDRILAGGPIHFVVTQGNSPKLTISAQSELLAALVPEVKGGELSIQSPKSYSTGREILVTIETPTLVEVNAQGIAQVEVKGDWTDKMTVTAEGVSSVSLNAKAKSVDVRSQGSSKVTYDGSELSESEFRVEGASEVTINPDTDVKRVSLSGDSKLKLGTIRGSSSRWDLEGASKLSIEGGSVDQIDLSGKGASRISASQLSIQDATIYLEGASNATLSVKQSVKGKVNGASQLRYGSPQKTDIRTEGASRASQ
jgi:Tfp pilus assembly protein PilZ